MRSTHDNPTIRMWVDAALALLLSWDNWPALRTENTTTLLLLEIEAEQLLAEAGRPLVGDGRPDAARCRRTTVG